MKQALEGEVEGPGWGGDLGYVEDSKLAETMGNHQFHIKE